ncbi:MAG: peptidoglycan editing factor PgeF [Burkholderiaceae bacterium]|nr:peptidoglycan editing factor PgeF [Burkholderiaceae bacterium]
MTADWLISDWPAPPGVQAVFTARGTAPDDGASRGPWAHFNLGAHVGDDALAVTRNRVQLAAQISARAVFLDQVHGIDVARLDAGTRDGLRADAAATDAAGIACTVLVADCLPVLLADAAGRRVAAVHCGWRGLAGGVLNNALAAFADLRGETFAWLGPCIGPDCFEVGPEVRAAFIAHDAGAMACFAPQPNGKFLADLPALARRRLAMAGVTRVFGNDSGARWCTVQNAARYFSYRRDQKPLGATGRMAACIWRTAAPA